MMHARMLTIGLAVWGMLALGAQARLGETAEQLHARYGPPVSQLRAQEVAVYRHDEQYIRVEFVQGRAAMLAYRRIPFRALTEAEISGILDLHASGSGWAVLPDSHGHKHWQAQDGERVAQYGEVHGLLQIMSRDYYLRRQQTARGILPGEHAAP